MQRQDAAAAAAHEAARRAAGLSPQPPHQRAQLHMNANAPGAAPVDAQGSQTYNNAAFFAAQQQQAAALALMSDIRAAAAAAQIRQAAQLQQAQMFSGQPSGADNLLLARAAQEQLGLGALAGMGGIANPHLLELQQQQELEMHLIQQQELELQRRQRAAQAAARQQQEEQAQIQQQQRISRQLQPQQRRQQSPPQPEEPAPERRPRSSSDSASATERQVTPSVATNEKESFESAPSKGVDAPKDRFKKTPGSMVVPCRARGMPMDHNFKTAYFVIPENVEHGDELICSYFSCRNAGIKFRYCTHCKVPVAKRNFRKRHKHGMSFIPGDDDGNGKSDESDDGESTNSHHSALAMQNRSKATVQPAAPGEIKIPKSKHEIAERTSVPNVVGGVADDKRKGPSFDQISSSMRPAMPQSIPTKIPQNQQQLVPGPADQTEEENSSAVLSRERVPEAAVSHAAPPKRASSNTTNHPKIDEKRASRWESLLGERPPTGDSNAMSSWLLEVLAVSDLDKPLADDAAAPAPPPPPPIIGNGREQKEVSQPLKARQGGTDASDASMPSFASLKKYKKRDHAALGRMGGPGAANAHSGNMGPRKKGKGSNGK